MARKSVRIRCRDEREHTQRRSIAIFPVIGGLEPEVCHSPGEAKLAGVASAMKAICNADVIAWASVADESINAT